MFPRSDDGRAVGEVLFVAVDKTDSLAGFAGESPLGRSNAERDGEAEGAFLFLLPKSNRDRADHEERVDL